MRKVLAGLAFVLTGLVPTFGNAQVAAFFRTLYSDITRRVEAEFTDTVLDVYASTLSLGGRIGFAYSFQVTALGLGASNWNIDLSGAAFGVPNGTVLTVFQILLAANNSAAGGLLYGGDLTLRNQAFAVFTGINGEWLR